MPEREEERKEDDWEDLEPVRPGGEPGASVTKVVISLYKVVAVSINERW